MGSSKELSMLTRSATKKLALDNLITTVFRVEEDDDLALFLDQENTRSIDDIIVLSPEEIDNASIWLNSGGTRFLASCAKSKLVATR